MPGTTRTCGSVPQAGPSRGQSLLHSSPLGQSRMPGQAQPASQPCFLPVPLMIAPVSLGVRSCPLPVCLRKGPVCDSWLQSRPGKQVERWALVQEPPTAPAHLVTRSPPQGKGGVYAAPGTRRQPGLWCWNNLLAWTVCEGEDPGDRGKGHPREATRAARTYSSQQCHSVCRMRLGGPR